MEAISVSILLSVSVFKILWTKKIFTYMLNIGSKKTSISLLSKFLLQTEPYNSVVELKYEPLKELL